MGRFTSVDLRSSIGFDEDRGLLVLPLRKKVALFLVGGEGLTVYTDPPDVVTVSAPDKDVKAAHKTASLAPSEKGDTIRRIDVTAGTREGTTTLRAASGGVGWAQPIEIRVIQNADRRQVGSAAGETTTAMREEIAGLPLRDAVIRVAEDQMNSSVCLTKGFGTYMVAQIDGKDADWCGAFAFYCWNQAAAIKNVPNPFGGASHVLWSPQRGIQWAMRNPDRAVVLRYGGGDPGPKPDTTARQEYHDIGWGGHQLQRGDIVFVRNSSGAWKHVTTIDTVREATVETIDGNQMHGGSNRSIKRRTYSLRNKVSNGQYELAFLHVLV